LDIQNFGYTKPISLTIKFVQKNPIPCGIWETDVRQEENELNWCLLKQNRWMNEYKKFTIVQIIKTVTTFFVILNCHQIRLRYK
jgi:hypothetical protein